MRWNLFASKGLLGFRPSGYEISGLSINPNRNPRMAFCTHSNSFASKELLGFSPSHRLRRAGGLPSGYEIAGRNSRANLRATDRSRLASEERWHWDFAESLRAHAEKASDNPAHSQAWAGHRLARE